MQHLPVDEQTPSDSGLGVDERQHFDLVIANARSMGWLTPDQHVTAGRHGSSITVRALDHGNAHERHYDERRWLYQFLHELARGLWKTTVTPLS